MSVIGKNKSDSMLDLFLILCCSGLVAKLCLTSVIPWILALQAPLSMGFLRQEYRSDLPFPSSGDLPDSDPPELPGKPQVSVIWKNKSDSLLICFFYFNFCILLF